MRTMFLMLFTNAADVMSKLIAFSFSDAGPSHDLISQSAVTFAPRVARRVCFGTHL